MKSGTIIGPDSMNAAGYQRGHAPPVIYRIHPSGVANGITERRDTLDFASTPMHDATPLSHRYCPSCGYDVTMALSNHGARCAECGTVSETTHLLYEPLPGAIVRVIASSWFVAKAAVVAGLILSGVLFIVGPATMRCRCGSTTLRAGMQLNQIHRGFVFHANDTTGTYAAHAALLVPANVYQPDLLFDPLSGSGQSVTVGDVDLMNFDWSAASIARLNQSIESLDLTSQMYKFGGFWFARLPKPTACSQIVFAWSDPDRMGVRTVVFDDSHTARLDQAQWNQAWRVDARARKQLGLPPLGAP